MNDELNIKFKRPDSYVVSVRLNAFESAWLTQAAKFYGLPLSTYLKQHAMRGAQQPLRKYHGAEAETTTL